MLKAGNMSSGKMNGYPGFFKFFLPTITDHRLRIPRQFLKHMEGKNSGTVSIMGPNRNIWHVELIENPHGVFLQNGWHDFVRDHSLQVGYCLVFRYEGNLHFNVQIFDTSACNKEYDCNVNPCNDSIGFDDHNIMKYGEDACNFEPCRDSTTKLSHGFSCKDSFKNLKGEKSHPGTSNPSETMFEFAKSLCKKPLGTTQLSMEKMAVEVQSRGLVENKAEKKRQIREALNNHDSNDFVSQRRPVEREEIARALESARSFKSKNKFVAVVMRKTHISVKFNMLLPTRFVVLALPKVSKPITLYGPNRKAWTVRYVYSRHQARLGAGWRFFSVGNNLEEYDVCVFEAIAKNKLQVHIFRVVDKIVPLIRQRERSVAALKVQPSHLIEMEHLSKRVINRLQSAYVSQGRDVKTEEIARVLQNARSFKSENYSVEIVMYKSYISSGPSLELPHDFVHLALPKVSQTISLYVPNRKEAWEVKYFYSGFRGRIRTGWGSFVVSNNLAMGDVCVFEVITKKKLLVHIFRGVDEFMPPNRRLLN